LLAALLCLFAIAYTGATVFGIIPKEQRIDATNVIIISITAVFSVVLINPNFLERLRRLKLAGFELEVDKIKQKQEQQQGQLEAMSLLLPLVLTEAEGKHLKNLAENATDYAGSQAVRSEMRKLRAMGLIRKLPDQHIGSMKDGVRIDIARLVELTPFGRRLLQQLIQIEDAKLKPQD
jgi:DNA-binding MarR family transcriptional regulator